MQKSKRSQRMNHAAVQCSMSTHVLGVHFDKTALMQTPLNALVVVIEYLGNLFIMPER